MDKIIGGILIAVLRIALPQITPQLRSFLKDTYGKLKEIAAKTSSPIDDLLVQALGAVLGLEG